jgi:hypothetical protein
MRSQALTRLGSSFSPLLSRLHARATPFARSNCPLSLKPLFSFPPLYTLSLTLHSTTWPSQARFFSPTSNINKMDSDESMLSLEDESDGFVPETVGYCLLPLSASPLLNSCLLSSACLLHLPHQRGPQLPDSFELFCLHQTKASTHFSTGLLLRT